MKLRYLSDSASHVAKQSSDFPACTGAAFPQSFTVKPELDRVCLAGNVDAAARLVPDDVLEMTRMGPRLVLDKSHSSTLKLLRLPAPSSTVRALTGVPDGKRLSPPRGLLRIGLPLSMCRLAAWDASSCGGVAHHPRRSPVNVA